MPGLLCFLGDPRRHPITSLLSRPHQENSISFGALRSQGSHHAQGPTVAQRIPCQGICIFVLPCQQQKFISHSSGGWKSEIRVPTQSGSGEGPQTGLPSSLCVLTWWKGAKELSWVSFIRGLILFMTITLSIRIPMCEF